MNTEVNVFQLKQMVDIGTLTLNLVFTQTYDKKGGDVEKQVKLPGNNTSTMDVATNNRIERLEREIGLLNKELANLIEEKRQKDLESYGNIILLFLKRALYGGILPELDVMHRNTIESEFFASVTKDVLNWYKGRKIQELNVQKDPQERQYIEKIIELVDRNIESIDQQRPEKAENRNRRSDVLGERIKILEDKIKLKLEELNELKPLSEQELGKYDAQMTFGILGFGDEGVGNLAQNFLDYAKSVNVATGAQGQYSQSLLDVINNTNNGAVVFGYTVDALEGLSGATSDATSKVDALRKDGIDPLAENTKESGEAVIDFLSSFEDGALIFGYTKEELLKLNSATEEASKSAEALGKDGIKVIGDQAKQAEPKLDSLNSTTEGIKDNAEALDKTLKEGKGAITGYGTAAQSTADKGLTKLEGKIEDVGETASNINLSEVVKDLAGFNSINLFPGFLKPLVQADEQVKQVADTFEETNKSAQNSLDELGVFAADIASEINETFADLIFRGLKGNLDSLSEFWDATFDAMLNTFAQFAATVISNPIRIALDAVLRGESGSGEGGSGGGKGFFGTLGGVFDIGKGFKTIGKGLMKIPGVSGIVDSITGLFAEGGALAGIGQFFSSALPVIGAIASVAAFAVPLISGLFKKTPRLDVDFDSIKTELGRRAAVVNEFLDPEFFSGNIAEISVKRKAGLGVGGDDAIKELIQEQIELTIESVQAILFELPLEMAKSLNDALLATEVDIDTVVAGERLLEFDAKGKKIKEKFDAFINGELQAKFLFAIRDFFVGAFESLGVLPENAQALIDEQFEAFKNAGSREARAEIGQELLATFGAFVDAFNIVSGNVNDSIGQTIQTEECEYRLAA